MNIEKKARKALRLIVQARYNRNQCLPIKIEKKLNLSSEIIPVVLCGGEGSRLWPLSRELHPKPFLKLSDGQTLLQKTLIRASELEGVKHQLIVTRDELFFTALNDLQEANCKISTSFILEPFSRNTAAAIASASIQIANNQGQEALILILSADHMIENVKKFYSAVSLAVEFANEGKLVTFGITPKSAETGYGYIQADKNQVKRFVEKPSSEVAEKYLESGDFLWNSGIFLFRAKTIIDELRKHCPEILDLAEACIRDAKREKLDNFEKTIIDSLQFKQMEDISIDVALLEKSTQVVVVECDFDWADLGSWRSFTKNIPIDKDGNQVRGEVLLNQTKNSIIESENRLIATAGVEDLIIIDTPDALLVSAKSHEQQIKNLVSELKKRSHPSQKNHRKVLRPWGSFTTLFEAANYKVKEITVRSNSSLSLQAHNFRCENWILISGKIKVLVGNKLRNLGPKESIFIDAGVKHRLINDSNENCTLIEVQIGEYLGEDDIVRFEDEYLRN